MAKLKHGAKAQAVRDALTANPDASAMDVVAELKAKRMKVTPQVVYAVKARMGKGKKRRGRKAASSNGAFTIDNLILAKKLAEQLGGVEKAKAIIDALSKLQ